MEDKTDETKDRFYEEQNVVGNFLKCHMIIMLGEFNGKVGREVIFKPTIGNDSLHEFSNDKGVEVINFATSKNLLIKSTKFSSRNFHKFLNVWASAACHEGPMESVS
jgi:hypothetical protein